MAQTLADIPHLDNDGIHPLHLALDVQTAMADDDWLVIDGGNTHFWSEIAVNIAGWQGRKLGNILHPGTFSMLGVGVPFATAAKLNNPGSHVVVISGDGAFLSGVPVLKPRFRRSSPSSLLSTTTVASIVSPNSRSACLAIASTSPPIFVIFRFTPCLRGWGLW